MLIEEIEALGWVLNRNSNIYSYKDYKMMYSSNYENKLRVWTKYSNEGFSDTIFEGKITSINELQVLLKQLGIE